MTTKATLYLDSTLYKALKIRAAETGQTVSSLMNEALRAQLARDLKSIQTMRAEEERPPTYEEMLEQLQQNGTL